MFDKFTNRAKQVIKLAKKEAQKMNHNYLGTEHVLLGLLKLGQGIAVNVLSNFDVSYDIARQEIEKLVGFGPEMQLYGDPALTGKVKKAFNDANEEAANLSHNYVGTEHLLLALIRQREGIAAQVLENLNLNLEDLRREILKELETFNLQLPPMGAQEATVGGGKQEDRQYDKMPALKAYGHDLTQMCREGKMDPVIGRKAEVERLILILCRRRKNNPVLIGEAGVGKTAIVEGLAHAIVKGEVPDNLRNKKLISLDLTLMIAGTKYRGQFEERIKTVMDEIKKNGNVLLFIDELHTIVGAGAAEGAIDASNILKPALSRGEIQCIGATTLDEYRKHIEKDAALERRFQKINVSPPSLEESMAILEGLKQKYEEHHKCTYTQEAVKSAVELSDRYISGRFLPDKAIDLMDEAGAKARILMMHQPENITTYEKEIEKLKKEKENAIDSQEYEKAAKLRDSEKNLRKKLQQMLNEWEISKDKNKAVVDDEDVSKIVAKQTRIPITRLTEGEAQKVLNMEKSLGSKIIGQKEALSSVCRAIRRSRANIKDPNRPIGSFLFLGPTGVGKTLLAKLLSTHMFGGEDALIQVDMSEYMEKFAISRMTGSPPGYVGHEEGGQLTEQVRQRPYCVILFDEVEKAHPDVMNLLLQILEEGKLTDSLGRKVDFKNTIIIMTSNLGADLIRKSSEVGFGTTGGPPSYKEMEEKITASIKKHFKPEFINRLDEFVIFKSLDRKSLHKIVDLEFDDLRKRAEKQKIFISLDEKAKDFLVEKASEQPEMGARPLKRAIVQYIEDPIAEKMLLNPDGEKSYLITIKNKKVELIEESKKVVSVK
jgi:ATP-dependent Clp protease ATP-binding subunit ClpC